ncbi:hypothetical protein A0H81_01669 [Grifola frondosa]|uniref:Uncharacterized protein n=1 Tax=Grifola frondosa TaxID=5627 RepID=A0A1C7MKG5_GRIFR|nr:hypothetical protein A0H81_01669 [Grifola frondosa]
MISSARHPLPATKRIILPGMFIDLNVPVPPTSAKQSFGPSSKKGKGKQDQPNTVTFTPAQILAIEGRLDLLVHLGYTVFALNQTVERKVDPKTFVNVLDPLLAQLRKRPGVVFLRRLTIVLDEESEKGFGLTTGNAALFTPEGGAAAKRNWWAAAREVVRVTKGKGVLVSSGATNESDLRAPRDVANLITMLDLSQDVAHAASSKVPQSLILRAQTRRTYRAVLSEPKIVVPVSHTVVPEQTGGDLQTATAENSVHLAAEASPARRAYQKRTERRGPLTMALLAITVQTLLKRVRRVRKGQRGRRKRRTKRRRSSRLDGTFSLRKLVSLLYWHVAIAIEPWCCARTGIVANRYGHHLLLRIYWPRGIGVAMNLQSTRGCDLFGGRIDSLAMGWFLRSRRYFASLANDRYDDDGISVSDAHRLYYPSFDYINSHGGVNRAWGCEFNIISDKRYHLILPRPKTPTPAPMQPLTTMHNRQVVINEQVGTCGEDFRVAGHPVEGFSISECREHGLYVCGCLWTTRNYSLRPVLTILREGPNFVLHVESFACKVPSSAIGCACYGRRAPSDAGHMNCD